jgi:hypothetical protein
MTQIPYSMKSLLIAFMTVCCPLLAFADSFLVTVKVQDRADDGSAIRELYVYPSAVMEPGETAKLQIGPELRFPIGSQTVDIGDGVSKEETIYETVPVGLSFALSYTYKEGVIHYTAKAVFKVSLGITGQTSEVASKEVRFYGQTELGGLVEAEMVAADGTQETIAFHFGPAPESDS